MYASLFLIMIRLLAYFSILFNKQKADISHWIISAFMFYLFQVILSQIFHFANFISKISSIGILSLFKVRSALLFLCIIFYMNLQPLHKFCKNENSLSFRLTYRPQPEDRKHIFFR